MHRTTNCTPLLGEQPEVEGVAPSDYILKGVELAIKPGECVAIIGRTGAGKSSLLAAILGEIYAAPDSKYSGLEGDLKNIQGGIDTVLGDKGVNLSGGQRTRISIARALYSQADIYLFDDPISALDVEVGRHIIEKCLLEYLDNKTRLVVIHSLAYLGYFDRIILMDEGRVAQRHPDID